MDKWTQRILAVAALLLAVGVLVGAAAAWKPYEPTPSFQMDLSRPYRIFDTRTGTFYESPKDANVHDPNNWKAVYRVGPPVNQAQNKATEPKSPVGPPPKPSKTPF